MLYLLFIVAIYIIRFFYYNLLSGEVQEIRLLMINYHLYCNFKY